MLSVSIVYSRLWVDHKIVSEASRAAFGHRFSPRAVVFILNIATVLWNFQIVAL